jgi:hypothetical protein
VILMKQPPSYGFSVLAVAGSIFVFVYVLYCHDVFAVKEDGHS